MAISQISLITKSVNYKEALNEEYIFRKSETFKLKKAFLCHSHKDKSLVEGMIVLLRESGVELYVDWLDNTLPEKPDKRTAEKIQNKISNSDIFLFLATDNSMNSRWCPWEIGYADASSINIFVIPTSLNNNTYGNEYLELYQRIDMGNVGGKLVLSTFLPGEKSGYILKEKLERLK